MSRTQIILDYIDFMWWQQGIEPTYHTRGLPRLCGSQHLEHDLVCNRPAGHGGNHQATKTYNGLGPADVEWWGEKGISTRREFGEHSRIR